MDQDLSGPMTRAYFIERIGKFQNVYGRKYSVEAIDVIYRNVSILSKTEFDEVCISVEDSHNYSSTLPAIPLFKQARLDMLNKRHQESKIAGNDDIANLQRIGNILSHEHAMRGMSKIREMTEKDDWSVLDKIKEFTYKVNQAKCRECNDSGMVSAKFYNKQYKNHCDYLFKCFCIKGQERTEAWPVWNKSDKGYVNFNII